MNRNPRLSSLAAAALLLLAAAPARAAAPREALLVSTAWLAEHLKDPDLVLLHVGDRAEYDASHLPGARFISQREVTTSSMEEGGLMLEMLPAEELRSKLASYGISDGSRIVVYYGKDWVSPSTRILLVLEHAGLGGRASLLDGGQKAWVAEGRAVTAEVPAAKPGTLSPLSLQSRIVDAAFVREHLHTPGWTIVDARDAEFYDGRMAGGDQAHPHRSGHVAGARSFPFTNVTDDDFHFRSDKELAKMFVDAGIPAGDKLIFYCHIGQQASAALYAARLLGREAKFYDGSFEDWSRQKDAPVDGPVPTPPATSPKPGA